MLTPFTLLLTLIFLVGCVDEFWPKLDGENENLLVVGGMVTNASGPYTIQLSHSSKLTYPKYFPISGYEVIITDDIGNSETLTEVEDGTYSTAIDGIQGEIGRSYKLIIHEPSGKTYESDFGKLIAPIKIDTVYTNIEYRENEDLHMSIPGNQFYITTKPGSIDSNYIRWQLIQTYEYTTDFLIYFYYDGTLHPFPKPDSLETCWKTSPVYSIYCASTEDLTEPLILDFPLHYVSFDQRDFSIRYSLLVRQLTMDEKGYKYWQQVNEQNTSGDGLYSQVPYQIRGNIHNVDDENEPVLGYFEVAGVDDKRIFINRPPAIIPMYYPICELTEAEYQEYGWMFRVNDWRDWPIYVTVDLNGVRAVPAKSCSDCQKTGGSIIKPDFWENE